VRAPAHIVVDVGGTHLRVGTADPAAVVLRRRSAEVLEGDPVAGLAACVRDAAGATGREAGRVTLGLPGSFDAAMERILSAPNLPMLEGLRVAPELAARLELPVCAERDIVLHARGEWAAGAGQGAPTMLGVFVGTGVGGAFLDRGRPLRGASGGAVEVGHLPVMSAGRRCVCGNMDCLEAYACGGVLARAAAEGGVPVARIWHDRTTEPELFLEALARGLAAAVNMLDPACLVVGGGVPAMEGFPARRLVSATRAHLRRPVPADAVTIRFASLGEAAAMHGAAAPETDETEKA